ncbi:MAG TPA: flavodoxin family protein [Spirochaetota bacterium]|nr:flavodoxin family protein [Spirochaetota bacterium]
MNLSVMGVSGSPVKNGNVELFMRAMLGEAARRGASVEAAHLSRLDVRDCVHCNFCLRKQEPGRYCSIKDDAQGLFENAERADILLLASPVYFMRTSGRMACFLDRLRVFVFGNVAGGRMRDKIGVSAAVAWARHGGFETTHLSHLYAFLTLEMIPASAHDSISPLGASAVASKEGAGGFDPEVRLGAERDLAGIESGLAIVARAMDLAAVMKRGMC